MPSQNPITLLHVSDMQFGRNHRFGRLGLAGSDEPFDSLVTRLTDDLKELERDHALRPDVLVVSGDLAEWGMKKEFDDALEFLRKLSAHLGLPPSKVVIVPGNHDLNRLSCEAYFTQCKADDETPLAPYFPKWKQFAKLFQDFYGAKSGATFSPDEPYSWFQYDDLKLVVAGLNSTMVESHLDDTHYGHVGERQYRHFRDKLEPFVKQEWLRIGVVHHNPVRGATADDENLRDAPDLKKYLGRSIHLLMHGHTHNGKLEWLDRDLPSISTGSAALTTVARPDEVPNQYQFVRVHHDGVERWTRQYDVHNKRWIGDTRSSDDGGTWHTRTPLTLSKVSAAFAEAASTGGGREPGPSRRPPKAGDSDDAEGDLRRPRHDFLARVQEICQLRETKSTITRMPAGPVGGPEYLRVCSAEGSVVRSYPLVAIESGVTTDDVAAFARGVHATFRAADPAVGSELVYGGDPAPPELVREASRQGVALRSFIEYQGILDLRGYVQQQAQKLNADPIYPPSLYVPQRLVFEIGSTRGEGDDARKQVVDWLLEPDGRFILVLGSFGTGKTFLLHELALHVTRELPHLIPVLIELRALEKGRTLEQLVAQHLAGSGVTHFDLDAFRYMLRQGRVVLLFDGFDELVLRITYDRATEHFATLMQAADGRAKVVVSSRTQHFVSDAQVKMALYQQAERIAGLRRADLQLFNEKQVRQFLVNRLKSDEAADRRMHLIHEIKDLLGLSETPRMLGFIADLEEEKLREAKDRTGTITSAELYRLLLQRWLDHEHLRQQPNKGSEPALDVSQRWEAATALALRMWRQLDRTIKLADLTTEVGQVVEQLPALQLDKETAAFIVGSGTLLVRDGEGTFAFVHQSVLEWLVANRAAEELRNGTPCEILQKGKMSDLMADFLCGLAGDELSAMWASETVSATKEVTDFGKSNALTVRRRLAAKQVNTANTGVPFNEPKNFARKNLSGEDLSGQRFTAADFSEADLTDSRLIGRDLTAATLHGATLVRADLTRAVLRDADLSDAVADWARAPACTLTGARLAGSRWRGANLMGSKVSADAWQDADVYGAALSDDRAVEVIIPAATSSGRVICFSRDGTLMGLAGSGGIQLCEGTTGRLLRIIRGQIRALAFSPDGRLLASAGVDNMVRLWDPASGREVFRLGGHAGWVNGVAFSPDGRLLASAGDDRSVRLWDPAGGRAVRRLDGHRDWVRGVAFSPDGRLLASAGGDKVIRLWDPADGREVRRLDGHASGVWGVAFGPDGRLLASAGDDGSVRLWDPADGREVRRLDAHTSQVNGVAFSPDGRLLASAGDDKVVWLWDLAGGRGVRRIDGHVGAVNGVAFSPGGRLLASAGDGEPVRLWDPAGGREVLRLGGHAGGVRGVAFSPDGRLLASAGEDRVVRLWDPAGGRQVRRLDGHGDWVRGVAFSPDGQLLASAGDDSSVRLWDPAGGREVHRLGGHAGWVNGVAFSPDGRLLASAGVDNTVRLWDPAGGRQIRRLDAHVGGVLGVAFSPDGRLLASAGGDKVIRLWDPADGREVRRLDGHASGVRGVAFGPDGRLLASAGDDGSVRLWDPADGREVRRFDGHGDWVRGVVFSPDGRFLASAGDDNTVRLWDPTGELEVRRLDGHGGYLYGVAFSPDGKSLLTAGAAGIDIWDVASGRLSATLLGTPGGWAAVAADGCFKRSGNTTDAFWYAINLCRLEPEEAAQLLPDQVREVPVNEPLPLLTPAGRAGEQR